MSDFEQAIAKQVSNWAGLNQDQILQLIEAPKNFDHGDYAIPIAKINKFKRLQGKPEDVAKKWASEFVPDEVIKEATAAGPYINFKVNKTLKVKNVLLKVLNEREKYGFKNLGSGKKIIVEFSSPNIAKPFHAGHLRSTIIGNFIKNLHKAFGFDTTGINYLGDWGKQYGLLALGFLQFGNEESLKTNPIKHLFDVYVAINAEADKEGSTIHDQARAYFKKMEDGDPEALGQWKKFRDLSIEEYKKIYARLGVEFDVYSGESEMEQGMIKAVDILKEKNLLVEDKGAKVIDLKEHKLGVVIVKKSDDTTLYITRDIAAAAKRHEQYHFDKMYYVVASQQDHHFQQLFKILELMDYKWSKDCIHINYGLVKGMSTRKGTAVFLEDILEEAKASMLEVMKNNQEKFKEITDPEQVADTVGLSAVIIQDFSAKRIKDYEFNWHRMTAFDGDTGPYLQYAHARICSMERKTGAKVTPDIDFSLLSEPVAQEIATLVDKYPEVLEQALSTLEACGIVNYLFQLGHAISAAHAELKVKDQPQHIANARMTLFWAAKMVLSSSLKLLGVNPLERM